MEFAGGLRPLDRLHSCGGLRPPDPLRFWGLRFQTPVPFKRGCGRGLTTKDGLWKPRQWPTQAMASHKPGPWRLRCSKQNQIPKELIESYDEVIKKPIDERFKKYEKYFSYHEVSDELRDWLLEEFKTHLITGKEKFYYWVIKDMPMFVNHTIQEVNFYPLKFVQLLRTIFLKFCL